LLKWKSTTRSQESRDMSFDLTELKKLSRTEKLQLFEVLHEELANSSEARLLSETDLKEALRRSDELKTDPSIAIDRDELWRRVDE
jgi:putative addiction module component (TIGR02574 family)